MTDPTAVELVLAELPHDDTRRMDPLLSALVVRVLTWLAVNYGPQVVAWVAGRARDLCARWVVKRAVKASASPDEWRAHGSELVAAVLAAGGKITADQARAFVLDAGGTL